MATALWGLVKAEVSSSSHLQLKNRSGPEKTTGLETRQVSGCCLTDAILPSRIDKGLD